MQPSPSESFKDAAIEIKLRPQSAYVTRRSQYVKNDRPAPRPSTARELRRKQMASKVNDSRGSTPDRPQSRSIGKRVSFSDTSVELKEPIVTKKESRQLSHPKSSNNR